MQPGQIAGKVGTRHGRAYPVEGWRLSIPDVPGHPKRFGVANGRKASTDSIKRLSLQCLCVSKPASSAALIAS
jgi:hypothetical protein